MSTLIGYNLLIPAAIGTATSAFALARCFCSKAKEAEPEQTVVSEAFPFHVKALPPFEGHEAVWKQKTGLEPREVLSIDQYVQQHLEEWQEVLETLRIAKETSGLPRTLVIYRANGKLSVQVCCKTKGNLPSIGQGGYKRVKRSIEWLSRSLWVQSTIKKKSSFQQIIQTIELHEKLSGKEGIAPPPQGKLEYKNKMSFFTPLRQGDCQQLLKTQNCSDQISSIVLQVLKILDALEEQKIIHGDIKAENFLYYRIGQQIKIELNDFDLAKQVECGYKDQTPDRTAAAYFLLAVKERNWSLSSCFRCGNTVPFIMKIGNARIPAKYLLSVFQQS